MSSAEEAARRQADVEQQRARMIALIRSWRVHDTAKAIREFVGMTPDDSRYPAALADHLVDRLFRNPRDDIALYYPELTEEGSP